MGQLCKNMTTPFDLYQIPPTSTEDLTLAATVSNVQSDNKNKSSHKGAMI